MGSRGAAMLAPLQIYMGAGWHDDVGVIMFREGGLCRAVELVGELELELKLELLEL